MGNRSDKENRIDGFQFLHICTLFRAGEGYREEQYGGVATCGTPEALVAIATSVSSFRTTASATTATAKST